MTIKGYLENPYGKGSAFAPSFKDKIQEYKSQYQTLLPRFKITVYKYRKNAIYHIIVPSHSDPNLSYDVIIEVDLRNYRETDILIDNLDIKVFSNCPSFIFSFANAFKIKNLDCRWLSNKFDKNISKSDTGVRNEYKVVGLERSLYLAMYYIHTIKADEYIYLENHAIKLTSLNNIIKAVRTQSEINQVYNKGKSLKKDNAKPKETKVDTSKKEVSKYPSTKGKVKTTKTTRSTNTIKNSKSSKTMKNTKKVKHK